MSLDIVPVSSVGGMGLTGQESSLVVSTTNTALGFYGGGDNGEHTAVVTTDASTEITHDIGVFSPAVGVVSSGNTGHHRLDQTMATANLGGSLQRDVLIATFTDFSTSANVYSFFPWREWASNTFVQDKLKNFNFIRGTLRLHGQIMGPALASGLVVVSAVPTYEATATFHIAEELCLTTLSVLVDCSKSNTFELKLPWMAASNWGNLTDDLYETMWNITVRTLTGVQTAVPDGCATTTMRVFASPMAEDFEIQGPIFQSRNYAGTHHAAASITPRPASNAAPVAQQLPDMAKGQAPKMAKDAGTAVAKSTGYKLSDWAQGGAFAAGMVALYPPATPIAGAIATGLGMFAKALDYFGLTRATTIVKTEDALIRIAENMVNADGPDYSRKAALFSTNITDSNALVVNSLTTIDECSLAYLYGKYTKVGKLTYTVGDMSPEDHRLPVTPMYMVRRNATDIIPTTAGYVGANFAYWRGDVKFLIVPVVSATHRGSFQFIWQPVPNGVISDDLTNIGLNAEVPIEPGKAYEITIGYNNDYPMAATDFYQMTSALSPIDYATLNGYLVIRNLNPITGSVCGSTIDVHIFVAAGENLEFGGPTGIALVEGEPLELGFRLKPFSLFQGKAVGDTPQVVTRIDLVPSSGAYPVADNLMGEEIRSLRALMMKPSLVRPVDDPSPPGIQRWFVHQGQYFMNHSPYISGVINSDYLSWFGTMFLGFAGAIRYKYIANSHPESATNFILNCPMIMADYTGDGTYPVSEVAPIVTANTVATSVTVPFYHNELFVPAYKAGARSDMFYWPRPIDMLTSEFGNTFGALYRSIDESARFIYWRGQNGLRETVDYAPSGDGPWYEIVHLNTAPPALAREAKEGETREKMSLEQYRARTGRPDFRRNLMPVKAI